ncbi:high mobility group box domain-containing protein [Phycomyces blakesleeanus]|uniref:High mobility group box domain-containing protein n=1 Tax=Phycomyces blakesleeanus TaxID=4837 RepID=A0ABR3B9T1_PHYBL
MSHSAAAAAATGSTASDAASEVDGLGSVASDDLQPTNKKGQGKSYRKYNEEPERLKRPPNAYLLFNRFMRSKLLKVNPNLSVAEISKSVSAQWKELSEKERKPYNQEASRLKQEHMDMHPNFVYTRRSKAELEKAGHRTRPSQKRKDMMLKAEALGQGEASTASSSSSKTTPQLKVRDPRGRKKKRLTHPTAPKHPMSGFLFFAGSVRQEIALQRPSASVGDVSKIIAGKWRELTDAERNPWCLRATEDKGRYAREMQEFMAASKLDSRTIATVVQMVNPTDRRDFMPVSEQSMEAYQFQVPATPPSPNVDSRIYSSRNNE